MQEPVLVLNATFEPINVTAVRRAMVLLLKGVAQAEEMNHTEVHSTSRAMQVPSVIRLLAYRHIPQQTRALSRKNILLARPQHLPVLRARLSRLRVDARSRGAALARRPLVLGKSGGLLLPVQQSQRGPHAGRSGHQAGAAAPPVYAVHFPAAHAADWPSRREVA